VVYQSGNASLAESNIVEKMVSIYRMLSDEVRELSNMVREFDVSQSLLIEKRYERVRKMKNDIEGESMNLMEYFVKVAEYITSRELYATLIEGTIRISEDLEATAYRLYLVNKLGSRVPDRIFAILSEVSKRVITMVDLLSDMLRNIDNEKVVRNLYAEITRLEDSIDEFYREGGLECVKTYGGSPESLILKEALDKIEDAADIAKRVATYIWLLSSFR
jgi:uncharacterized protein Yka (UPF0111/DUF47 family)